MDGDEDIMLTFPIGATVHMLLLVCPGGFCDFGAKRRGDCLKTVGLCPGVHGGCTAVEGGLAETPCAVLLCPEELHREGEDQGTIGTMGSGVEGVLVL